MPGPIMRMQDLMFLGLPLACFAVSAAYPLLPGRADEANADSSPALANPAAKSRSGLHLEAWWHGRGALLDSDAATSRALAAATSGKWDAESGNAAIRALIAEPGFINTLWERMEPGTRTEAMNGLLSRMAEDCPAKLLPVIDKSTFDLKPLKDLRTMLIRTSRINPQDTFAVLKRHAARLTPSAVSDAMRACAGSVEGGRLILDDAAAGGSYEGQTLEAAFAGVLWKDDKLPPAVLALKEAKKFLANRADKQAAHSWLSKGQPLSEEALRALPPDVLHETLQEVLINETKSINAAQLELLAASGHHKDQDYLLSTMAEYGRLEEAVRLLDAAKNLPATKARLDELSRTMAESVYESGGDIGQTITLINRINDETTYWKTMDGVLTRWAKEDPVALKNFLPQVDEAELRGRLENLANESSLEP